MASTSPSSSHHRPSTTTAALAASASTSASSPPSSAMIAIDIPVQLESTSVERAVKQLGGPSKIVEVVTNQQRTLEMNLFGSRLAGSVSSTSNGLLLKVTRTRPRDSGGAAEEADERPRKRPRVEVVGPCSHTVKFKGLRDFSLFSMPRSALPVLHHFDPLDSDFDPALLPPLEFSPYSLPREYRFAESVADRKTKAGTAKNKGRRKRGSHNEFFLNWNDPIPKEPRPDSLAARPQYMQHRLTGELKLKFLSRPIWSSQAILREMDGHEQRELIVKLLRSVAYRYRSGPWRFLWIRFGYEPQNHPESAKYQVVDYRMKPDAAKAFGARPKFRRRGDWQDYADVDHTFATVPSQMGAMFQLCDLSINEVVDLIQKIKPVKKPTQASGWISPAILDKVRSFMTRRMQFWMKQMDRGVKKSDLKVFPKIRTSSTETSLPSAAQKPHAASPSKAGASSSSTASTPSSPPPPLVKSDKLEVLPSPSDGSPLSSPAKNAVAGQIAAAPADADHQLDEREDGKDEDDDSDDEDEESEMESDDEEIPEANNLHGEEEDDEDDDVDFPLGDEDDEDGGGGGEDLMDDEDGDDDGGFDLFG